MERELHVSSLIVLGRPEAEAGIRAAMAGIAGAEVRACQAGRMVVVLETMDEHAILSHIHAIGNIRGVISTALVYHQVETVQDQEEGMAS